jgi:predicted nucleic acid-binding protein
MGDDETRTRRSSQSGGASIEVFCDSNVLLNYLNREWEAPNGVELLEASTVYVVISEEVEAEVRSLVSRRHDLYRDVLEFVLNEDGRIEEFAPDRRLQPNDYRHLTTVLMELSGEDRPDSLVRLREFISQYRKSAEALFALYIDEVVLTAAPFLLEMDLGDVIENSADRRIVAGAADWTSQGGSGVLVTNDIDDIVDLRDEINAIIEDHLGTDCVLVILRPREVEVPPSPRGESQPADADT